MLVAVVCCLLGLIALIAVDRLWLGAYVCFILLLLCVYCLILAGFDFLGVLVIGNLLVWFTLYNAFGLVWVNGLLCGFELWVS